MGDELNLQFHFDMYLAKVGLIPKQLPRTQLSEMKKSFMAGMSSMFRFLTEQLPAMSQEEANNLLNNFEIQLNNFWKKEVENV